MEKKIGIYKITSPSGKVYVGQSNDIGNRFSKYKGLHCYKQRKLYNSLKKYGVENHIFEIIEECAFEELNVRERYWQEFYDVLNPNKGLNLKLTQTDILPYIHSEETKAKMSKSQIGNKKGLGRIVSIETREKLSIANKGQNNKLGTTHSKETKEQMSKSAKSNSAKGKKNSVKIILNTETGIFYFGAKEAAQSINKQQYFLHARLTGQLKNKTPFIYV
jgi:group I intron endonuclease